MNLFYYTKHHPYLFISLKKYFKYIINVQLNFLTINSEVNKNAVVFLLNDEKEEKELLDLLIENMGIKVVTLGYDDNSSINIINFSSLKNRLQKILDSNYKDLKPLFTEEEIKEKLKSFFHSHGEDSLFEYLNWTIYYLREGPIQFISGNINYMEYVENFIKNGLINWDKFKSRYLKYKFYIKISKYHVNFNEIEKEVNESDKYVCYLSEFSEEELLNRDENFFRESIDKIEKVNHIIVRFYRNLPLGQPTLQNSSD
ncbi:MAG: hypothetical protein QXF25_02980 [Candidatus Pacearchaeota archaeon]